MNTRHPNPPPEPLVEVEAITGNWLHQGQPTTPGKRYTVPLSAALSLENCGKAKRV